MNGLSNYCPGGCGRLTGFDSSCKRITCNACRLGLESGEALREKPTGLKSVVQLAHEQAVAEGAANVEARTKEILNEERERTRRFEERFECLGVKADTGKLRYSLLPWLGVDEVVHVLEHGAAKYGEENWRKVDDARRRYLDAALRHIREDMRGGTLDGDSGRRTLAHAVASLLFVLELDELADQQMATLHLQGAP